MRRHAEPVLQSSRPRNAPAELRVPRGRARSRRAGWTPMIRTRSLLVISFALLILAGCGVNPSPAPTTPATVANVYVASSSVLPQIYAFPGNSTGAPTPANTITIPALNLVTALAVDSSGNIYAATDIDIREYAAGATGTATPIRTIPFDSTTTLTDSSVSPSTPPATSTQPRTISSPEPRYQQPAFWSSPAPPTEASHPSEPSPDHSPDLPSRNSSRSIPPEIFTC